jgi:hypothetical protein
MAQTHFSLLCVFLAARDDAVTSFEEMRISTGKEHGPFYLPRPIWVRPPWLGFTATASPISDDPLECLL